MIEQDYIMRMITMLAAFLARVLLLKHKKEFPQALLEIQNTGRTLLGIDRTLIRHLSPSEIGDLLGADPSLSAPKSYVLAVLLGEESDIRRLTGEPDEEIWLDTTALSLLIDAYQKAGGPVELKHTHLIDQVFGRLAAETIGRTLLEKVFSYYEQSAQFDKAENVLYDMLALDPQFLGEAMRFYERLLAKPDSMLEAGRLPRIEIVDALDRLRSR